MKVPSVDLCKFWILADRLNMPILQNLIMYELSGRKIPKNTTESESPTEENEVQAPHLTTISECCNFLWNEADGHDILKRYFLDLVIRTMTNYSWNDSEGEAKAEAMIETVFNVGFESEVVKALLKKYVAHGTEKVRKNLLPSEIRSRYFVSED